MPQAHEHSDEDVFQSAGSTDALPEAPRVSASNSVGGVELCIE